MVHYLQNTAKRYEAHFQQKRWKQEDSGVRSSKCPKDNGHQPPIPYRVPGCPQCKPLLLATPAAPTGAPTPEGSTPHTLRDTDKLPTPCHTVPTCEEANVQPLGQAHTAQGCWPALQKPEAHCCHSGASAGQGPAATGDSLTSFLCPDDRERRDILAAHCVLSWQLPSWGGLVSVRPVCAWTFPPLRGE